jgi:hypothetical protein
MDAREEINEADASPYGLCLAAAGDFYNRIIARASSAGLIGYFKRIGGCAVVDSLFTFFIVLPLAETIERGH